jgi:DNA-binding MarR family transcriptional regulator
MKKQDPADRMAKELSLTDAQKTQLAELDKEYDAKLKKILNDEQYKKYKQMRKHHGRPGRRGHGGPRGPRPEMPPTD